MSSNQPRGCCGDRETYPFVTQIASMSFGFIGFIMSAVAVGACNFMKMDVEVGFGYLKTTTSYDFGLFSRGNDGDCSKYSSEALKQLSSNYKAAQAFGVLGALFGGFLMIACFMMLFFTFPRGVFKSIGMCYIACFLFQMLTLLMLNENECDGECKPSGGAVTAIIAGIFYLGVGINILMCPAPKTAVITGGAVQADETKETKLNEVPAVPKNEVPAVPARDENAEDSRV